MSLNLKVMDKCVWRRKPLGRRGFGCDVVTGHRPYPERTTRGAEDMEDAAFSGERH